MEIIGDIQAKIIVNRQPLQEHEDEEVEDENPDAVVKYIEATSGAKFGINIIVPMSYRFSSDALLFEISLDGSYVTSEILPRRPRPWDVTFSGLETPNADEHYLRPFMFSEIKARESKILPKLLAYSWGHSRRRIDTYGEASTGYPRCDWNYHRQSLPSYEDLWPRR